MLPSRPSAASQLTLPSLAHLLLHLALLPFLLAAVTVLLPASPSSLCAAQPVSSDVSYTSLTNDLPVLGSLTASATAYYTLTLPAVAYQQTTLVSVAASIGSPLLYVSFASSPAPSASSFAYSASWQTGGVVAIGQQQQPPYTLYVAVQASAWSACNYTLLVEAYDSAAAQSTAIALSSAVPLASAIAAGEYRYYTYNVSAEATFTTVALTETYGQCWLLLNEPDTSGLPTLYRFDYKSSSPTFPLVSLPYPIAGMWTIGVWSNQSAAFSIMAAENTDTQPMELGVTYVGYADRAVYVYYSIYIDALQLAAHSGYLDLELHALRSQVGLFCSNTTTTPSLGGSRWFSAYIRPDQSMFIPTAQLSAGSLYCGVLSGGYASYTFSASYGSDVTLTSGESVAAKSLTVGASQLYSLVFPASSTLITLSVVCDVGTTALYIAAYGEPPGYATSIDRTDASSAQLVQLPSAKLCGYNNSVAIPGSSPPLCQMQVAVVTSGLVVYHITATLSGQLVQLNAGDIVEGTVSVNQSAYFSFVLPDNLSNGTLVVTVTNGATGLILAAGVQDGWGANLLWTVAQQPDDNVIVFQLDYTDPLLSKAGLVQGEYVAVLSTTADFATVSLVYTFTNGSDYTIVQLLDGVPQEAVVNIGAYSFYYFTPPAAGWPYAVTVSVDWIDGYGTGRLAASNGPQLGPLVGDGTVLGEYTVGEMLSVTPDWEGVCNPNVNASCGYSITVQGGVTPWGYRQPQQQSVYSITVTSGHWVRQLTVGGRLPTGAVLAVADSDYWQSTGSLTSRLINPQLVIVVSVLSGSVAIFASNMTSEPNVTTAQQTWTDVSSAAVLSFPLVSRRGASGLSAYVTVTCTSSDGMACQYTLQAQRYDESRPILSARPPSQLSGNMLLPAGGIGWVAVRLASFTTLAYLVAQAAVTVGTPSLYAECADTLTGPLPDETYHTWQATTAPLAIELFDFNVSANNCPTLILGVRASNGQAAWVSVSVAYAGAAQLITGGSSVGVCSPAYPTSYFQFPQTAIRSAQSVVLVFEALAVSAACTTSQLQLLVGDTTPFPNASDPSTYSFSRSAVTLASGDTVLSLVISNYTKPAGSLHAGNYYVAVSSTSNATCEVQVLAYSVVPRRLWQGELAQMDLFAFRPRNYFTFAPVPYNTSASFAVQLDFYSEAMALYVAVDNTPSPADPSSYLLSATYDSVQSVSDDPYTARSIYIPASACSSPTSVGQPCTIVLLVVTRSPDQSVYLQAMSSASATWLLPNHTAASPVDASSLATTFQLSLPASPLLVTLSLNTSSPLSVWCSYQYVTPDATFYDWQWQVGGGSSNTSVSSSNNSSTTQLSFAWANTTADGTPLQLTNPATQLAAPPTVCYCTVQASSDEPYSLAYSATPLPPDAPPAPPTPPAPSSSSAPTSTPSPTSAPAPTSTPAPTPTPTPAADKRSGLSGGALAAAVVVPVVCVVLLLAALLLLWLRRRDGDGAQGCCQYAFGKGGRQQQRLDDASEHEHEREVSMAELSRSARPAAAAQAGRLISGQWRSDRA